MSAYYNEHDPFAASWLRKLIERGLIAPGDVDERDIRDVLPGDLRGFTRCHFFAGIGGWDLALQLAEWGDRPVWTGSCPCQPFSSAGKGEGFNDPRHLWPTWFRLIRECRPPVVFGEQVASKDGLAWLDHVSTDLEAADYAFGAADLCAAGVGAPHIRQRLFYVAHPEGSDRRSESGASRYGSGDYERRGRRTGSSVGGATGLVGNAASREFGIYRSALVWLPCRDGKARPTKSGLFPLAHGVPNRVGTLRGAGNAILPQVGAEFIKAYREVMDLSRKGPAKEWKESTASGR